MKILLHICCGPCAVFPVKLLRQEGHEVLGFFYNPNIHPYSEYQKRFSAAMDLAGRMDFKVIAGRYDFEEFLKELSALADRAQQHRFCWRRRLEETARVAQKEGFDAFTTTLLSSPYQDIAQIASLGEAIAGAGQVEFLNRNFRRGFVESHKISKEWQLYHQDYCGCLYSEKERIDQKEFKKNKTKETNRD